MSADEVPPAVLEQIRAHARRVAAKAPKELTPRLRDELARKFIPTYWRIVAERRDREKASESESSVMARKGAGAADPRHTDNWDTGVLCPVIEVVRENGVPVQLLVDGQPFPWVLGDPIFEAVDGPDIQARVTVTILASEVREMERLQSSDRPSPTGSSR